VRRQVERLIFVAAVAALACGCAPVPPSVRLAVHVDTLAPDKMTQYEAARLRYAAELCARGLDDRRGLFLKVGDRTYYSVVTFLGWRELEQINADTKRVDEQMGWAAKRYYQDSDDSLIFPHGNEIWRERPSLSYAPTGRPLGEALSVVIEDVDPQKDYEAAWKPIAAALASARYPIERRTFFSAYGSGRYLSFWLASSRALLQTAPTLEQALVTALGEERATALLREWRGMVLRAQTLDVAVSPEMTSPCASRAASATRP
jgi:hypothetical protein